MHINLKTLPLYTIASSHHLFMCVQSSRLQTHFLLEMRIRIRNQGTGGLAHPQINLGFTKGATLKEALG